MKQQKPLFTDVTVIEVTYLGEPTIKLSGGIINSREKKVTVNGELIYTEWQTWPQFHHKENTSVALENLERQLSTRKQSQSTKKSSSNRRNFVDRFKFVWAKLFPKVVNLKT